ncbi:3-dehydroshikimate dehydratase-like protein [Hapsidospora chrysogenum ATCC 11550]|uniref:3-dehydroshikimate dehydratase-like protein n=1 Tax=Hapsidospora chrysogenum (strain ATCC 11550 / CBS 779.69 / DSM 880 / IAM 14645 / JCM 23072 / IMI 49137) TaxID=857340 RepID=A0A086TGW8_HAPC1|nr:3-dehydroshikimate dehydratase-like protein [Hapsidospora chrysogenum ATCC 11550]
MVHKPAICTMSLGRCFAGHSLAHKLDMARKYGFQGIEVFMEDLVDLTLTMSGGSTPANQLAAARTVRNLCERRGIEIICLQPLMNYGGLVDRRAHIHELEDAKLYIQVAHCLGTDLICLPSSFLPSERLAEDMSVLVQDMVELAELGLQESPAIRFAYEALCWGTRIDTWEGSWDLVRAVDRPNFGICFDTFNLAGRIFADPASHTGRTPDSEQAVRRSLETLVSTVDVSKVFLLQVADAERLSSPLDERHPFHREEQPCRMSWSRNCRLFYGESQQGAYLPARAILVAIVRGLGFHGWLSFEMFNRRLAETDKGIPEEMVRRAAMAWEKMAMDVPLQTEASSAPAEAKLSAML